MGPYKELFIYYFSGTGNSKNVALWVAAVASKQNILTQVIDIATTDRLSVKAPSSGSLVVFVSPIHGFNYPPVMLNFIVRFPKGNNPVLLMNTRAGMLIGKFITTGLTGIAFYFAAFILKLKGYSIRGMVPVDMPSNWISVHPGLNDRTIRYLHDKNKERVSKHSEKVISGKRNFVALREIVQDVAVSPISLGYYFIGRFFFAKTYYASKDCDNCGVCIKNCPVKAIKISDNRPFWTFNCESCMKCMGNCPKKAIETAHGFVIGFLIVNSLLLIPLFYKYFDLLFFTIENEVVKYIVETLLFLFFLAILHRIMHYCMRFRFIERIMVFTSLTKYKWWGRRYKALKNS